MCSMLKSYEKKVPKKFSRNKKAIHLQFFRSQLTVHTRLLFFLKLASFVLDDGRRREKIKRGRENQKRRNTHLYRSVAWIERPRTVASIHITFSPLANNRSVGLSRAYKSGLSTIGIPTRRIMRDGQRYDMRLDASFRLPIAFRLDQCQGQFHDVSKDTFGRKINCCLSISKL